MSRFVTIVPLIICNFGARWMDIKKDIFPAFMENGETRAIARMPLNLIAGYVEYVMICNCCAMSDYIGTKEYFWVSSRQHFARYSLRKGKQYVANVIE